MNENDSGQPDSIRVDRWLWYARFFKTRGLATRFAASGKIRVNSVRIRKASASVRVGDGLSFALRGNVYVLKICALGERRGPAPEARLLYRNVESGDTR